VLSRLRLPSPALVIASIALILAIGGGSFALAISDRKSDRRIARHVATKQIHRLAHTLQVKHARVARRAKFAGEATNASTVNGVSVTQFAAKVQPGQPAAILADTGLATLRGTCTGAGQHGVLLTKDIGSPPEVMGSSTAAGNSSTVANHGAADFSGTQTIDAGNMAGASIGHVEVSSTTGKVSTITFLARDASNFSPSENVCVFSGTVSAR
jgi:hypothetical protein